jgi:sugar phosphate isomerase/epimerase
MTNLSVQVYSVREDMRSDPLGTLKRLKDIGFEQVELYGFVEDEASYLEAMNATGLRASSGHASLIDPNAEVDRVLEAAVRLGIPTVIDPYVPDGWGDADSVAAIADRLNGLVPLATDRGVSIGYHNHWWEFGRIHEQSAFERFASLLRDEVVLEIDTYWSTVAGSDTPALLRRLGERVQFLHVKDGPIEQNPTTQLPVGKGAMDVAAVLDAAPAALRVLEFDEYVGDLYDGLAESLAYVQELENRSDRRGAGGQSAQ